MVGTQIVVISTLISVIFSDNRADFANKVKKLGCTFYTPTELQTIFKCVEPTIYKNPDDDDAILSGFPETFLNTNQFIAESKSCILNNSGNKALQALSLYNNANKCLDPESLDDVVTKLTPPLKKMTQQLLTTAKNKLMNCKTNNQKPEPQKQNACAQQVYKILMAGITKKYVNNICQKIVNQHVTKQEWGCGLKYLPNVADINKYECSKIVKN